MSLRFAILGLLAEQPLHGYAIQSALEERFGELCDPSYGEVYRVLAALARAGLVVHDCARVGKRPRRKIYSITPEARRALRSWLLAAPEPGARTRGELPLRLLIAERCAPELLSRLIEVHARRHREQLAELESLRTPARTTASFAALVRALRVEGDIRHARASVEAVELCRDMLARHQAGTAAAAPVREVADRYRAARSSARPARTPPNGARRR